MQMFDRDTKKTVHLRRMQRHRQNTIRTGSDQEISNQAGADRDPRRILLVGARVSVVGYHDRDARRRRPPRRVQHQQQLNQMLLHTGGTRGWMIKTSHSRQLA